MKRMFLALILAIGALNASNLIHLPNTNHHYNGGHHGGGHHYGDWHW